MVCPPLWIFDRKIKQLEHAFKCFFEAVVISSFESSRCPLELATNVAELFEDRKREPAIVFESFVDQRFHWMSESTIATISCRVPSSSTPVSGY